MALPANKIKKIKLPNSTEAYEIIPERLQNNGFEASLPTLSTNSTIALKSDVDNSVKKSGDSMSGNLNPATNKVASLGTSSLFWNNIYGTTLYENGTSLVDKYANKSHTHTKSQITDFSHTHSKSEVGLGNVDNTSDANKPVSNATQQALNNKANASDVYTKAETNNKINKPLYNLGAYDTISGNVITRQTGYVTIEDSNILSTFTSGGSKVFAAETNIILPNAVTDWNQEFGTSNIGYKVISVDGSWIFNKSIAGIGGQTVKIANNDFTTIDQFKALCPINIQYKMTTSYTEEIIEGQPLITLDQQGSQWLRDEWEKGLNLWSFKGTQTKTASGNTITLNDSIVTISGTNTGEGIYFGPFAFSEPIKANKTYTISIPNQYGISIAFYDVNGNEITHTDYVSSFTFTPNVDMSQFTIWITGNGYAWGTTTIQLMLNEGDHPYPYQAYNSKAHITNYEADFLKSEAERSANLGYFADREGRYWASAQDDISSIVNSLPSGTYTFSFDITALSIDSGYSINDCFVWFQIVGGQYTNVDGIYKDCRFSSLNNTKRFSLTFNKENYNNYTVRLWGIGNHSGGNHGLMRCSNIALNEGSVALPYQPYEGKVVHEKELESAIGDIASILDTINGEVI